MYIQMCVCVCACRQTAQTKWITSSLRGPQALRSACPWV